MFNINVQHSIARLSLMVNRQMPPHYAHQHRCGGELTIENPDFRYGNCNQFCCGTFRDRSLAIPGQADPKFHILRAEESSPEQAARLFEMFQTWACDRPSSIPTCDRPSSKPYALVGCCGLRGRSCEAGDGTGIELAPTYWGRYAYAIEAGCALL